MKTTTKTKTCKHCDKPWNEDNEGFCPKCNRDLSYPTDREYDEWRLEAEAYIEEHYEFNEPDEQEEKAICRDCKTFDEAQKRLIEHHSNRESIKKQIWNLFDDNPHKVDMLLAELVEVEFETLSGWIIERWVSLGRSIHPFA